MRGDPAVAHCAGDTVPDFGQKVLGITDVDTHKRYWIWLSSLVKIGPKAFYDVLAEFEDAKNVWDAVKLNTRAFDFLSDDQKACIFQYHTEDYIDDLIADCQKKDIMPVTRLDDVYPALLAEIKTPPPTLYIKGDVSGLNDRTIAVVGTRKAGRQAVKYTEELTADLSRSGVSIVSGMARGIDTAAHTGALNGISPTYGVLGCGADVIYPKENAALYEKILQNGAIISEYLPGAPPLTMNFPMRNRIISGLSRAVVVVESMLKGGANITVKYAIEQGRDVMAVPDAPHNKYSQLPNFIIKNGGIMVESAEDILREFGWGHTRTKRKKPVNTQLQLDFFEQRIYNLLLQGDFSIEEIENRVDMAASALYSSLTMMEMKGIIQRLPGNSFGIK